MESIFSVIDWTQFVAGLGFAVVLWGMVLAGIWMKLTARRESVPKTLLIDDMRDIEADIVARTYDEGIQALKTQGPFKTLYLDHDLGDGQVPERTGYTVMCWLEEHPEYLPGEIILVTSNPVGRKNMQAVILKLYRKERNETL